MSFLCVLEINLLSVTLFANIFLHSVGCPFVLIAFFFFDCAGSSFQCMGSLVVVRGLSVTRGLSSCGIVGLVVLWHVGF